MAGFGLSLKDTVNYKKVTGIHFLPPWALKPPKQWIPVYRERKKNTHTPFRSQQSSEISGVGFTQSNANTWNAAELFMLWTHTHPLSTTHTLTELGGSVVFVLAVASEAPEGLETEGSSSITPLLSRTLKRQCQYFGMHTLSHRGHKLNNSNTLIDSKHISTFFYITINLVSKVHTLGKWGHRAPHSSSW